MSRPLTPNANELEKQEEWNAGMHHESASSDQDSPVLPVKAADEEAVSVQTRSDARTTEAANKVQKIPVYKQLLHDFGYFVSWAPKRCRYDANNPPKFTLGLNLLFSFVSITRCSESIHGANFATATTATVGNLYCKSPQDSRPLC